MPTLLNVDGLAARYGPVHALSDIHLRVDTGEIVALLGSNGAGKSTLMRTIIGLVPSSGGTVSFEGGAIDELSVEGRVDLGIATVLEGRGMLPRMSVIENLLMGAYLRGAANLDDDLEKIFTTFPVLRKRVQQAAGTLSGGEQQMLAIGRALMLRPKLILMDEPSMGLAPVIIERVFDAIEAVNKSGATVLLVEQNARMALSIAHRFYVISNGKIVINGRVDRGELFLVDSKGKSSRISEEELENAYMEGH